MSLHVLHVTGDTPVIDGERIMDDREYRVECVSGGEHCEAFQECARCHPRDGLTIGEPDDDLLEQLERTGEAHGLEHRCIDGLWMVRAGHCYVMASDDLYEAAWELEPLEPGEYPVDWDAPDGTDLTLVMIEPEKDGITHACPVGNSAVTPCCGQSPFELMGDRMTLYPTLVSCSG